MELNEMDARLISQGTQVESVDGNALVSVATAEGQPQSNITLANFADSLGSAVPAQQTEEQVSITGLFAKTADGKMVELTKESVASVVAGLIGLAGVDKDGLASTALVRGTTATETTDPIQIDFNEYTGQSIALVSGANSPTGNTTRYYLLIQKEDIGRMKIQTAQDYETGLVYHRTYTTKKGEWSAWVLENFGYNSMAELSAGVARLMGNPIGYKGLLDSSHDLNDIPDGIYCSAETPTPLNSPSTYNYVLVQISHQVKSGVYQIIFDGNEADVWYRRKFYTSWSNWLKVTFT